MTLSSAPRAIAVTSDPAAQPQPRSPLESPLPNISPNPQHNDTTTLSPPSSPQPFPQQQMNSLPPELRSPMYIPSDSSDDDDVEYVATHPAPKPTQVVSDHVRITLQQLELRNAILSLPTFNREIPFSLNDKAVASSLADMRRSRIETRSSSLLILTTSEPRARRWRLLLTTCTELQPILHFQQRPSHLDRLLHNHGTVITPIATALVSAKHHQLYLRRLALLVIDSAEQVTDRAHAAAVLIRDFYRALPERHRPRILAIARTHIPESAMYPLEYNLLSHFVSANVTQDVRWPTCLGKGSRPLEAGLIDLEYLYYHPSTIDNNELHSLQRGRNMPTPQERDRRGYSEIDHLVDRVGPLGVAAYAKMKEWKRQRRMHPAKLLPEKLSISDADALVGLTSKALSLINEIHLAYAASTRSDPLAAIVYAGRPVVACALCELVRAFPIFQGLCARVALGAHNVSAYQKDGPRDDFEDMQWQGEDTDDEEVSSFTAGETNILFVANPFYSKTKRQRPLPPTPLVFRFDGSSPDPEIDGGGGRCRVVVFREHEMKRNALRGSNIVPAEDAERTQPDKETISLRSRGVNDVACKSSQRADQDNTSEGGPTAQIPNGSLPDAPRGSRHESKEFLSSSTSHQLAGGEEEESHVYHCAPAKPLLGPTPDSPAFLYRVLLFNKLPGSRIRELEDARESGVEDFLLVFSKRVAEDDIVISLSDIVHGTGNGTNACGYLKLDFQGSITLSTEQLSKARQYTEEMFSLLLPHVHKPSFIWDKIPMQHGHDSKQYKNRTKRCRKYLVVPGKRKSSFDNEGSEVEIVSNKASLTTKRETLSGSALVISKYFGHATNKKEVSRVLGPCEIDWETLHTFLSLLDRETYLAEARKSALRKRKDFEALEGMLLFSTLSGGVFALSGRLRYDVTPLTQFTRSRKFPLNDDGTFMEHDDLAYLLPVIASEKTISKQAQANLSEVMSLPDPDTKEQAQNVHFHTTHSKDTISSEADHAMPDSSVLSPAKWSQACGYLVRDNPLLGKRKRNADTEMIFDCDRNVKKKRKTWVGRVRYSSETYFNKYHDNPVSILDQPLLGISRHRMGNVETLLEVVRGTSLVELCERFVATGTEKRLFVPELAREFPLSVGAIHLPPVLFLVEKHLSLCELRAFFDSKTKAKGTPNELLQAVTSSAVNSSKNYERLELLGDSVLKLSSTVRLFTKHPYFTEGQMHHARAHLVSNARLHRRGERRGLFNYVRFQTENSMDWLPPGTDLDGRVQRLTVKGLADVVEAICGVYFLFGSRTEDGKSENVEVLNYNGAGTGSDWEVDLTHDSFPEDSDDDLCEQEQVGLETAAGNIDKDPSKRANGSGRCVEDRAKKERATGLHPLSAASVERGYVAGYKFLEACSIFDDHEPSHSEILLSAAHAMLPKGSKAPQEVNKNAFPRDDRLLRPSKPWDEEYGILENHIGYKFKRRHLLLCAITHGSYIKRDHRVIGDEQTFQRLEFLGDAVADFCVVRYLYEKYPELGPGELTELKGNVVSNEAFARTTVALGLHKFLCHASIALTEEIESYIGTVSQDLTVEDELGAHGGFKRSLGEIAAPKVLGDIFEAILGAVFVDAGLQQAWRVCMKLLEDSLRINADPLRQDMHPCTELSELTTGVWKLGQQPKYDTKNVQHKFKGEGNARARLGSRKVASVYILNEKVAEGHGSTVKRAKLKAAVAAMNLLKDRDPESEGGRLLRKLKEKCVERQVAERRHSWS